MIYSKTNKDAATVVGRSTHAIRAMAASLAFSNQVDIDEILRNCSWKNHTTFSNFYLKDMTQMRDDLHSLGPLVVAEKVEVP